MKKVNHARIKQLLQKEHKYCEDEGAEQMLDEDSETIDNSYLISQNKKLKERVSYLEEQVSQLKYFQRGNDNNIIRLFDKIDNLEKKLELLWSPCEDEDGEDVMTKLYVIEKKGKTGFMTLYASYDKEEIDKMFNHLKNEEYNVVVKTFKEVEE